MAGRKSKYEKEIVPRFEEIKRLVGEGATDKEIIEILGIHKSTFYDYMNKYKEFSDLMRKNRQERIDNLKDSLYKKAMGFQYTEVEKIEDSNGYSKTRTIIKTSPPSETAILILLKHWDKNEDGSYKWANDPATLELKKKELELKKEQAENEKW